jgi:hypothetical protein
VVLDPPRQPSTEVALGVVHKRQPVIRHGPKLHC